MHHVEKNYKETGELRRKSWRENVDEQTTKHLTSSCFCFFVHFIFISFLVYSSCTGNKVLTFFGDTVLKN